MEKYSLDTIRHSAAHIMAAAVQELYPDAKFDIGPSTSEGFYYDFDMNQKLTPEDLVKIENLMKKYINKNISFEYFELTREEAKELLHKNNQTYKIERLNDIQDTEKISFYKFGNFIDLCTGPHVKSSGEIGAVKLLSIAGSYFRGKETNPMLQRIYGTAFHNKKDLNKYLKAQEEAKKRDHRKLGKELDLFSISEEVGGGLVLWHPNGALIRNIIEDFWKKEHYKRGYDLLYTPHIGKARLWETSGHLNFYKDTMYSSMKIDETDYYIKPMNCPYHIEIYRSKLRSYKELPLRWAELGTVYRYEKSGVLHGLLRVRGFTQDDAHIICTPEQIDKEVREVLRFCMEVWHAFGFKNIKAYLATKPDKSVGSSESWKQATDSLNNAIEDLNLDFEVEEGGGAFYGPKIDLKIKDAIGREWQMSTIQFDFNLSDRFDMHYIGKDGQKHQPYMVHRAIFGSIERFFGILTEHFSGAFPVWLSPVQTKIIPISENHQNYAKSIEEKLLTSDIRVETDNRSETIGTKIKDARHARIPYLLVVGDKEQSGNTVSVRARNQGQLGEFSIQSLTDLIREDINMKK